jgi:beta-glucosidase
MSVLDDKVSRVLRVMFRTSMNPQKIIGSQCSETHYEACRQIGEEGIVLLKNEGLLPLDAQRYQKILVVGENATRSLTQGGGSSELKTQRDVSPLDGLRAIYGNKIDYAKGYNSGRALYDHVDKVDATENARLKDEALQKATSADLIIFIGGLNKNHKQDCENGDRESYNLSFGQNDLIAELAKLQKNIIVVCFGGNPYATPWLAQVGALFHCWYLGSESGTALANVLSGKVCPSGKLPVTFAKKYEDYPYVRYGAEAYPGVDKQVTYKEDVFVGYRGFEKNKTAAQFPFGFGLSYTTFKYGKPVLREEGDNLLVDVTITNTGTVAGKETAQVYVSAPKNKQMAKPVKELKAFGKTDLLQPGATETVSMTIPLQSLASWNEATHDWQTDRGTYTLHVGASSADIREKITWKY